MKTCALVALAVMAATATADKYRAPWTRVFVSSAGTYAFRVVPPERWTLAGRATGVLFTYDLQGREKVLWRSTLVNLPSDAVVTESGRVATLNTYARSGYEHALVVYGDRGQALGDYRLEDLLTAKEISQVPTTASSRWWIDDQGVRIDEGIGGDWKETLVGQAKVMRSPSAETLLLKPKTGRVIRVDFATGKLLK